MNPQAGSQAKTAPDVPAQIAKRVHAL
jgi:hypothetical protein